MYNSIPTDLNIDELTTVVHYCIKILNKFKSKDNRDVTFDKIPFKETNEKLNEICRNFLFEINVENLRENDFELDKHINQLFLLLATKIKSKISDMKLDGEKLLRQFDDGTL